MLTAAPETAAHPAHLERRRRAAAADDRHRLERMAQRSALRAPRRPRSTSRAILADPSAPGRDVRAARDRRDRHRVRDRALRRRRAAARRRAAHAARPSTPPTRTGPKAGSRRIADGEEARAVRLRAPTSGRLELAQQRRARARSRTRCAPSSPARLQRRAAQSRCRTRLSAAHGRGFADYFTTARNAAAGRHGETQARSERVRRQIAAETGRPAGDAPRPRGSAASRPRKRR